MQDRPIVILDKKFSDIQPCELAVRLPCQITGNCGDWLFVMIPEGDVRILANNDPSLPIERPVPEEDILPGQKKPSTESGS